MPDIINWFAANWIEIFGVSTGAICVWALARDKASIGWSFGIINAAFFIVLFMQNRIYAETALNTYYLITCIWGFILWKGMDPIGRLRKREKVERPPLPVARISNKQLVGTAVALVAGTAIGTWLLGFTDTDVAFLDAITTTASLIAQFLLAKKVFENWYIWIAADVLYVGLFFYKGLYLTSGLYLVFIFICIDGIRTWKKIEAEEKTANEITAEEVAVARPAVEV